MEEVTNQYLNSCLSMRSIFTDAQRAFKSAAENIHIAFEEAFLVEDVTDFSRTESRIERLLTIEKELLNETELEGEYFLMKERSITYWYGRLACTEAGQ